jgi:hypothetical protein
MVKPFALITTDDLPAFVRWMDAPTNCKPGFDIVPHVVEAQPDFDMATERLEKTRTVTAAAVTDGWTVAALPADEIKRNTYHLALAAGYTVPGLGITLATQESDRNAFTGLLTLVNEAVSAGLQTEASSVTIADITGTPHTVTVAQLRGIMLGYGQHLSTLWAASK